jgi:hypothetical protein
MVVLLGEIVDVVAEYQLVVLFVVVFAGNATV